MIVIIPKDHSRSGWGSPQLETSQVPLSAGHAAGLRPLRRRELPVASDVARHSAHIRTRAKSRAASRPSCGWFRRRWFRRTGFVKSLWISQILKEILTHNLPQSCIFLLPCVLSSLSQGTRLGRDRFAIFHAIFSPKFGREQRQGEI